MKPISLAQSSFEIAKKTTRKPVFLEEMDKASVRAKVGHLFRLIKCQFSDRKTHYKGLIKHAMSKNQFLIPLLFLLASCSGVHPFSKTTSKEANEILTYDCESDVSFRIQILNKGQDVWLIYPDHEVNLSRVDPKDNRYTSGVITLVLDTSNTTLTDGDHIVYQKCQLRHQHQ